MTAGRTVRRAPLFVAGSVAGFTGLIAWHAVDAGTPVTAGTGGSGAAGRSRPAATAPAGAGKRHAAHHGTRSRRPPAHHAVQTATGPNVNFGYGNIAVKVTVRGTRIIAVSVAGLQTLEPTSQQICAQAIPVLRSEVLSAQSASINSVSGASYTSYGYAKSVQAALDALHA
jgi:uncharacterized protein with FMN-binding domain